MKLLLAFAGTLFAVVAPSQIATEAVPDLVVLKFSCGQYVHTNHMIRSVQDPDPPMNEPIKINQPVRNEPQELINRRDMQERRVEMRTAEINAELSKQPGRNMYFYRLDVKNTNEAKTVKSFTWSYQSGDLPDPSDRQFYCAVKAKPKEGKGFELFSPLAPSRVVDAAKTDDKSEKNDKVKVLINQIEYADGSVWQRHGWNPATFPTESRKKVAEGRCIGL